MKKRIFVAAAALACVFALAGCGAGIGDLAPENAVRGIRSESLSALDGYTASSVDGEGFVVAERLRNGETEYALYDIRSQQLVTSDETFIAAEGYDGLYYTASVSEDGTTYTYVFYDGTEQVCTVSQTEEYLWSGGVYSFVDGNILYKGLNGEVYYGQRQGYEPVATPANTYELFTGSRVMPLGEEQAASFAVYDEGGSLIRIASPLSELERYVPDGATLSEPWYAGGRVFVQAVCSLPDDASAYDYVRNGTKYSADVLVYDLLSGGVEVLSGFGYVVDGTLGAGENCAVLLVRRIMENGRVSSAAVAQSFGEDGGVFVDLQALLPGAVSVEAEGGYAALTDGVRTAYFRGDDLLATLSLASDAEWLGAGWLRRVSDPAQIMNAAGETVLTLPENASLSRVYENYIYYTVTEGSGEAVRYVFDAAAGQTEKLEGYFSDGRLALYGFYLAQNAAGGRTLYDFETRGAVIEGLGAEAAVSLTSAAEGNEQYCVVTATEGDTSRNYLVVREYDREL